MRRRIKSKILTLDPPPLALTGKQNGKPYIQKKHSKLEVPITLVAMLHEAGQRVFMKMKDLLQEYYVEPLDRNVQIPTF